VPRGDESANVMKKEQFDVLVVGGGPAGIAAAVSAAECDCSVALLDENNAPGGQIWRGFEDGWHQPPKQKRASKVPEEWFVRLRRSAVNVVQNCCVFGSSQPGHLLADVDGEPIEYVGESIVLATGARERFLPFPGWTLPNVVGAGGLQALVQCGLPIAGKRVVVAGSGPLLLAVAAHLAAHRAKIAMILEQAPLSSLANFAAALASRPSKLAQGVGYRWQTRTVPYRTSAWPLRANGSDKIESLTYFYAGWQHTVDCDYLACGFHLVPNTELAALLGCELTTAGVHVDDLQRTTVASVYCAGETAGVGGLDLALVEGQIAGIAAAGLPDRSRPLMAAHRRERTFAARLASAFALRAELRSVADAETIVCRCEDVRRVQLDGHHSWRAAKLLTRCGMGACQGRICGAACEFLYGWKADSQRLPVQPVSIPSLMGRSSESPIRSAEIESMQFQSQEESK